MNQAIFKRAAAAVHRAFPRARPVCGLILGTGWGELSRVFTIRAGLDYHKIPGLGGTTVSGHAGRLLWGACAGLETFIFQGRRHWYEGAAWEPIAVSISILKFCGAKIVVLTNAAGGIRRDLQPGSLMLITDHINAVNTNPLIGPHEPFWGARFPDQSEVYDRSLRQLMQRAAGASRIKLRQGVYIGVSGPAYETPAEIRAFRVLGADAVGCSTVPEAILAHAAGMRVAGLSCITNWAAGISPRPLAHDHVQAAAAAALPKMARLIEGFWREMAKTVSGKQ